MKNTMDEFLSRYGSSRYRVSKVSGIPDNTLVRTAKMPLSKWKIGTVDALAATVGISSVEAFLELKEIELGISKSPAD